MTQNLNPFSGRQFLDANGDPYSGAKLFTYTAGSSTKVTLTKDLAGASNHTNPIILNSRGEPADGAGAAQAMWQTGGAAVKLVLAPSTDTDPPVSPINTWDNLSGINDSTTIIDQWVAGPVPTFVSTTSFTLVGDQTTAFHVGRRLKLTDSGGADYGVITVSAYTTLTTITVVLDSGSLDSGLSAVSYGLLSSTNHSVPTGPDYNWTGQHTHTKTQTLAKGADIASANDLPLGTDGNYFDVTGTTTINGMTEKSGGAVIRLHFDGILTLKHNTAASASYDSFTLPGSVDITTAAGDEMICISDGIGNNWRVNYYPFDGRAVLNERRTTTFTASGTYTPTYTGNVKVTVVGAGGGGGGGDAASTLAGGGGGGGQVKKEIVAVTKDVGVTVTIGTEGTGGAANTTGGNGTATSFGSLSAIGGNGGVGASAGGDGGQINTPTGGTAGDAAAGLYLNGGGGGGGTGSGGYGGFGALGHPALGGGGGGGGTLYLMDGAGAGGARFGAGSAATANTGCGGGGGGGNGGTGAAGGSGLCIVEELE